MLRNRNLKRLALEFSIILAFLPSSAVARASDEAASESASTPAKPRPDNISESAESQPEVAATTTPVAALQLALQQLRETVEEQSARLAKQTQELESERGGIL